MVTIGITSFNYQDFLADAIESALDQTVPCEIIVCDDGSTDHSLEIAKKYEPKIKVISQVNKGLPSARNSIIMNMTGDYFLPLDADDVLKEDCVEKIESAIKEFHPDVIAPSFKTFGIHNQEVILGAIPSLEEFKTANRLGYFSAIKKSVLQEVGGYNPKMIWGYEDWDLWIDIFKRGHSLAVIAEPLVLYRTKESSMLTNSLKHHDELVEQMRKNHSTVYA